MEEKGRVRCCSVCKAARQGPPLPAHSPPGMGCGTRCRSYLLPGQQIAVPFSGSSPGSREQKMDQWSQDSWDLLGKWKAAPTQGSSPDIISSLGSPLVSKGSPHPAPPPFGRLHFFCQMGLLIRPLLGLLQSSNEIIPITVTGRALSAQSRVPGSSVLNCIIPFSPYDNLPGRNYIASTSQERKWCWEQGLGCDNAGIHTRVSWAPEPGF